MKNKIIVLIAGILAFTTISCSTLKQIGYVPEIKMQSVALKGLDFEGITFSCDYSISNPYPLSFSIDRVAASVICSDVTYVNLSSDKGVNVAARGSKKNTFNFKIPYETILKVAKSSEGKESIPFKIKGAAYLDLSAIPLAEYQTLELPFNVAFDVPVFKPTFSVSNPKLVMPTVAELTNMLKDGGMAVTTAAKVATQILSGKSITEALFEGVDLNFKFTFDLNVANKGSAAWQCSLDNCAIRSSTNDLIDLSLPDKKITADSNTIPVTATLNTLNAGKFIVQLLNKSGKNPVFTVDSKVTFPDLKYAKDIPLTYNTEIPLGK